MPYFDKFYALWFISANGDDLITNKLKQNR